MRGSFMANVIGALLATGGIASSIANPINMPIATGNEKGSKRTTKFSKQKPSSTKQWSSMRGVITAKELSRRIANARDYNKGLETKTRVTKSGKTIKRVIPNPGTLVLGVR